MNKKSLENWVPRTELGRKVLEGEITSIQEIFEKNYVIKEPEIVDYLVPDLEEALVNIGGVSGKGGGKRRVPIRSTVRMHKSGRRRTLHAMAVVGNKNGIIGVGIARGKDARSVIEKAIRRAKMNVFPVRRGCGSWECGCKTHHSIPMRTVGKTGSVRVVLMPAPKGVGLVVGDEIKKVMVLAGIKDVWSKTFGDTRTRMNFVMATINALKNLNKMKISEEDKKRLGVVEGVA